MGSVGDSGCVLDDGPGGDCAIRFEAASFFFGAKDVEPVRRYYGAVDSVRFDIGPGFMAHQSAPA